MTNEMELVVGCDGGVRCVYDEALDLREIGRLSITRASHVEPDSEGYWWADMGPSGGPVLGPYQSRGRALQGEKGWLTNSHNFTPQGACRVQHSIKVDTNIRALTNKQSLAEVSR